jgi:hypothetical protein
MANPCIPKENTRFEKLMTFNIVVSLIGLFAFKKGIIKQISDILLVLSIILNMLSKTTRFWNLLPPKLKALWVISIFLAVTGSVLFMVLQQGKWTTAFAVGVVVHTFSVISFYKQLKNQKEQL